jgi:hypothetical protein
MQSRRVALAGESLPRSLPHHELYQGRGKLSEVLLADLARRLLLLAGLLVFLVPLLSLMSSGGAPSVALVAVLALMTAARPASGLVGLALVLPLAFALTDAARPGFTVVQVTESFVLAFIVGAIARSILDGRLFMDSRLVRPALSLGVLVAASGLLALFGQYADAGVAMTALWRAANSYFVSPASAHILQPAIHWLEFAALVPLVELSVRRRPAWRHITLLVWLGAGAVAGGQTILQIADITLERNGGFRDAVNLLLRSRLNPLYADLNAAGSLFAMLAVTAIVLGVMSRHRLAAAIVSPFLAVGLFGTQSRAAFGAVVAVFGFLATRAVFRSGRRVAAVALAFVLIGGAAGALSVRRPSHVGIDAAVNSRVELSKIALKIASQAPVFGVGQGRFVWASRDYIEPGFVATFPGAALGENAHNNFLQVLAELGCMGLIAFVWLLWSAMRPTAVDPPARAARTALVAGLAAFFLSALFGHPLLIYPIAAATFVTIGFAAGTLPAREITSARGLRQWAEWLLVAVVLISMPWRISAALAPDTPEVVGAGPVQPALEGVPYRAAETLSRWRVRQRSRTVVALMRWDHTGATDCRVRIRVRNRPADEVSLRSDSWIPVRFSIPPGGRPSEPPVVEFEVSNPTCRLFVGTVTALR